MAKPRWKLLVELIYGGLLVLAAATILDSAISLYPFTIRDGVTMILAISLGVYGSTVASSAWKEL